MADKVAILRHLRSTAGTDNWFHNAIKNNAASGLRILTSLPSQAVLAAKIPSAGVIGAYGQVGRVVPLPGAASARTWSSGVAHDVYDSTVGTVDDIRRRWSPVLRGDWDQVGRNLESGDALIMALELATAGRVGGGAAGAARRGAARGAQGAIRRGVDTPLTRYLSDTKHFTKDPTAPIRQRGSRTYKLYDSDGNVISTIERDLGRLSKNVAVRPGQRLRTNLANTLQENVLDGTKLGQRQFDWRARQQQRKDNRALESLNNEAVTAITRDAQRALNKLKKDRAGSGIDVRVAPFEDMAAFMHAQGWLQSPDRTLRPAQIRDQIVQKLEAGINERAAKTGDKSVAASRRQIEVMRSIPESYLDLQTAPSRLRTAVAEVEKMGLKTRDLRLKMVQDDGRRAALAESFDEASLRGAGQLHAGLEFDPKKQTATTVAAKTERDAAKAELTRLTSPSDPTAARVAGGAVADPALLRKIRAVAKDPEDPGKIARLEKALERTGTVGSVAQIVAAARRLERTQRSLATARRSSRGKGEWTARGPMWEGQRPGTYIKHVPIDPIANPKKIRVRDLGKRGGIPDSRTSIMQGLGPIKNHKSRGELLRTGNLIADPKLAIFSAKEAVAAAFRAKFADDFTTNNAIKMNDGKTPVTGTDALQLVIDNPDSVVLVAKERLVKSLEQAAELDDGKVLTDFQTEGMFYERLAEGSSIREEVLANPDGYIAVPKAFHDAALGMMKDPRTQAGRMFDSALTTWKSGMLVYAPRWWVNNLIGNSFMFGMLAGADLRSVRQAIRSLRNDRLADIIPSDMKAHGLVNEVMDGRRAFDNPGDNRLLTRVGRFTESMFMLQNSMEQVWRRAAYINQLKKQARDAGKLDRKLRIADADEALIAAADELPGYVKADALDTALRFLGDYQNMTQFERTWMRRVFPFYGWLRVISRLTFSLPFKHPGRLLAMAYMGQIATEMEQPLDDLRAYYEQGAFNLPGDLIMRTSSSNPLSTLVEPISKAATGDITGASREFLGQTNPIIQLLAGKTTGVDAFTGREYTAPPIWNGSYDQFGMGRRRLDETGRVVEERPTPSWLDLLVRATPVVNQVRPALSDRYGYTPYGTTSTLDMIRFALGNKSPEEKARLFMTPSESARPITRSPWSVPLGYMGFPVIHRNEEAEVDRALKDIEERFPDARSAAQKSMERNIQKFLAERGG